MACILGKVLDLLVELLQFLNSKKKSTSNDKNDLKDSHINVELEEYRKEVEQKMKEMELKHQLNDVSKTQEYTEEEVKLLRKKVDLLESRISGLIESVYLARLQEPPHNINNNRINSTINKDDVQNKQIVDKDKHDDTSL